MSKKLINVMDTSFRDGFQSVFGARVLVEDFLPALKSAVDAGIKHFEVAGGARFQAPIFFCNENAFETMDKIRETVGPDIKLQSLARGVNVVGLNSQPRDVIDLHAKMFAKHGVNVIRNFDALNDVNNLIDSANSIKKYGLQHEVTITMMELPYGCEGAHDVEFYVQVLRNILDAGIPFDESDLNNSGNNVNVNYETERYQASINDYVTMQFKFGNFTDSEQKAEDCVLSYVRYSHLYVPQPDYDASMNAEISEYMIDGAKKVHFSFPTTLTKDELLENSSENAEEDGKNVKYMIESEVYMGDSGYEFEFNDVTGQLKEVRISWLP